MKYRTRTHLVDTFRFDGTADGVLLAQDWLSSLDVSNCEVSSQGTREPYALDLITNETICILEEGDWLIHRDGLVTTATNKQFGEDYEHTAHADE